MNKHKLSIPAFVFLSVAVLSVMSLAGCGSSGSGNTGSIAPTGAKNIYALEATDNNGESVVGFSASATGNATPVSTLVLPSGFVGYALAVGPQGQIYVCGRQDPSTATYGTILEYAAGASGSAAPTVTLNGSAAGKATFTFVYNIAVNSAGTLAAASQDGTLETFAISSVDSGRGRRFICGLLQRSRRSQRNRVDVDSGE